MGLILEARGPPFFFYKICHSWGFLFRWTASPVHSSSGSKRLLGGSLLQELGRTSQI